MRSGPIQGIGTEVRLSESRELSVLAAQFGVTKGAIVRGVIRYALAHKTDLRAWLKEHGTER